MDRIKVSQETARLIGKRAEAQGITVEAYLRALVKGSVNIYSDALSDWSRSEEDEAWSHLQPGGVERTET